jgi:O-antigen/teichoic acid export membrane protein
MSNKIKRNSGLLALSYFMSKLMNYGWGILIARLLSVNEFGEFTYIITIAAFIDMISDLGTSNYIIRNYSKNIREVKYTFVNIFLLRFSLFLLTSILAITFMEFSNPIIVLMLLFAYFLQNTINLYSSFFRSMEKMEYESLVIVVVRFTLLILTIILSLFTQLNVGWVALSLIISNLIGTTILTVIFIRLVKNKGILNVSFKQIFTIIKGSIPFALTIILTTIYFRIDVFFIKYFSSLNEVGYYNAAFKFIEISLIIPFVLVTPILPILSKAINGNIEFFKSKLINYIELLSIIGLTGTIIIIGFAKQIIIISYGNDYFNSIFILIILALFISFQFPSYVMEYSLNVSGLQRYVNYNAVCGILINIILNFYFVPRFGGVGAAYTTIITAIIMNFINYFIISSKYNVKVLNTVFKSLIILVTFLTCNYVFESLFINTIFAVVFIILSLIKIRKVIIKGETLNV